MYLMYLLSIAHRATYVFVCEEHFASCRVTNYRTVSQTMSIIAWDYFKILY